MLTNEKRKDVNRPDWDLYFLNIASAVSLRSEDLFVKIGAVIVNTRNHIIGTGYNAYIKNANKNVVPVEDRNARRPWCIHAEENALLNCTHNYPDSRIYITGEPCNQCLQRIINFGIIEIIYLDSMGTITENEETRKMKQQIIDMSGIKIRKIKENIWNNQN